MSSRNTYTALTPEYANFARPFAVGATRDTAESEPPTPEELAEDEMQQAGRWRRKYLAVVDIVKNNMGLLLVTGAQAFLSLVNVAVKRLNSIDPPVSTFELIAVRMIITYVCSMVYMIYAGVPDPWLGPRGVRLLLVFRGFSGFFGVFGIYYSLQYLSLSDATVLTFLAPLCTGISGAIFLKERYTKREALASIISLLGVVLIARPAFLFGDAHRTDPLSIDIAEQGLPENPEKGTPEERLIAVGVALIGVLGSTGAYTSITAIGKRAHPLHALTSFSLQSVIVAVAALVLQRTPIVVPTKLEWLGLLVMIGIFGFIAQILLTMGLQRETAGRGSIAVYTQIVFAAVLERIFFKTTPSVLSVVGTLIIITTALYVAVTKDQMKKSKNNVRLRGLRDGALEEGLLEGLLEGHLGDQSPVVKDEPEGSSGAHKVKAPQTTHFSVPRGGALDDTTALPAAEGTGDEKAST
ncbi:hypothetical protein FPV67DRAFT_238316 [Lyophyllum atratum]|nr:hypothetical protein FPV67DRAFT_238316 [Lyophyllum atratum]